jgi:hypothetical protein
MKDLEIHEKLFEAEAYIERQKEYIDQLEHEKQLLYGRLNMIRDLTEKKI